MTAVNINWEAFEKRGNRGKEMSEVACEMYRRIKGKNLITTTPKTIKTLINEMNCADTPNNRQKLLYLLDTIATYTHDIQATYDHSNKTILFRVREEGEQWYPRPITTKVRKVKRQDATVKEYEPSDLRGQAALVRVRAFCRVINVKEEDFADFLFQNRAEIERLMVPKQVSMMMQRGLDKQTAMKIYESIVNDMKE